MVPGAAPVAIARAMAAESRSPRRALIDSGSRYSLFAPREGHVWAPEGHDRITLTDAQGGTFAARGGDPVWARVRTVSGPRVVKLADQGFVAEAARETLVSYPGLRAAGWRLVDAHTEDATPRHDDGTAVALKIDGDDHLWLDFELVPVREATALGLHCAGGSAGGGSPAPSRAAPARLRPGGGSLRIGGGENSGALAVSAPPRWSGFGVGGGSGWVAGGGGRARADGGAGALCFDGTGGAAGAGPALPGTASSAGRRPPGVAARAVHVSAGAGPFGRGGGRGRGQAGGRRGGQDGREGPFGRGGGR